MSQDTPTLCFIGAGNMAGALIGGLIREGHPPDRILASDPDPEKRERLQEQHGIRTEADNRQAAQQADIVVLAVKPQVMKKVCASLLPLPQQPLFISIAAGLREADIEGWLGGNRALVRCMPNTPALLGLGASGLHANRHVSAAQKAQAERILQAVGIVEWVDEEDQLDAVTAVSGSGPAYFFLFIEALQNAGETIGLEPDTAARLARQTALGAARMALDHDDVAELRRQVTSPGGTTEQAIRSFLEAGLPQTVEQAVRAARDRAAELADELGQ